MSVRGGTLFTGIHQGKVSRGTDRRARSKVYCHTSGRTGVAHSGAGNATAAQQVAQESTACYQARTATSVAHMWFTTGGISDNELAARLKHEGIRAGEIIAYRAWRVINPGWFRTSHDRLHSVFMEGYVWHLDKPASGDVRTHGIYSFRHVI